MSDTLSITPFTEAHLDGALALSKEAGWPHRREDWDMNRALSHGFVAVDGDQVLGTIFATPYGAAAATINMVIVDARLRGRGIGRRLMDTAFAAAGDTEFHLVATEDGLPLYEKLGFRTTGEILQYQGSLAPFTTPEVPPGAIAWADGKDMEAIAALDQSALGLKRTELLDKLRESGRLCLLRQGSEALGYACLRPFGRGEVVGPVVAQTLAQAKALIAFVLAERTGAFIRVDTDAESGLAPWLAELGLAHVGGGIRMVRPPSAASGQPAPTTPAPLSVFALASQALG